MMVMLMVTRGSRECWSAGILGVGCGGGVGDCIFRGWVGMGGLSRVERMGKGRLSPPPHKQQQQQQQNVELEL